MLKQGEIMMSWKSSVKGSTTIACYRDPNLNGKKVKVCGYSPLLNDLGPPNLFIPEGHTGTLTGLVEFASFAQELPVDICPIECMILVEVCWDNIDNWHDGFCDHGRKVYRYSCLIDIFMGSYKIPANFLFFIDDVCGKTYCVEQQLRKYVNILSITQDPLNPASPRITWVQ